MALMTRLEQPTEEKTSLDITINLPTLQFESALSDDERNLQYLRKRAHAITVSSCAQATYLAKILNEARHLKKSLKSPQRRSNRILQDQIPKDPLKVGILGCGRLGNQLAHCLLTFGNIHPKDLKVSTRRPETLEYLLSKGVDCFHDNIKLVTTTHIVFLCVLPAQIPAIADEVKNEVPQTLFIYSFASAFPAKKIRQLFGTTNVVVPEFKWDEQSQEIHWNNTVNVTSAFENQQTVLATCPLTKRPGFVYSNPKLAELMIFVFVNMCTHLKMNKYEVLDLLQIVIFNNTMEAKLEVHDFVRKSADKDELFPTFDLLKVLDSNTAVLKRLNQYSGLYNSFIEKYCLVFEEYLKQKLYNEMYQT